MAEPARIDLVLSRLEEAEITAPNEQVTVCRDPNDDKFFECALAGRADYIVSEDKDILAVAKYQGTQNRFGSRVSILDTAELGAGYIIPGGAEHEATALEPLVIVDVFTPPREEYR